MRKLDIKESIEINTSSDKAWEIIGPNFLNIADWGRGISKSWNNDSIPATIEGAPAGGRFCDLGKFGVADEKILHYSNARKEITWSASSEKLPGFLVGLQNALNVEAINENTCRVSTNITADLAGIRGLILGTPIKSNFTKLLKGFLKDWKTYSETGMVSDTKKRELEQLSK
ncbi:MAG: SRPBCC family protein [Fidelibacterota bacterium]